MKKAFCLCIAFYCLSACAPALRGPTGPGDNGNTPAAQGQPIPRVSINYQDVDVRIPLRLMAEKLGINLVVSGTVVGTITLVLNDVPADEVIDIILKQKGLGVRKNGKALLVAPQNEINERAQLKYETRIPQEEREYLKYEARMPQEEKSASSISYSSAGINNQRRPGAAGSGGRKSWRQLGVSPHPKEPSRERYGKQSDNPVKLAAEAPVSTFSVDVDTGSYSNVRRMLQHGQFPPADAVRVEEMINYFPYDEALPDGAAPFAVHTALAPSPWNSENLLLRVVLKGEDVAKTALPPVNLVFLVDVSGSMNSQDKLPLLVASLKLLAQQMRPQDKISLVTYAGRSQVALSATPGNERHKILAAIDQLSAGGSTAGASGIQLAYGEAEANFIKGGINRILLATDGDFNVGVTDFDQLKKMVEEKRKSGVSLSTLGFGTGNYNEHLMEQLADVGNGAYSYIDSLMEGHKVLVNESTSTLATIAKDVKIQIEFNPEAVHEYRLIGYENRLLAREDFNNDKVDAGDIGAGHTVTALYELTPVGKKGAVDPLRYGEKKAKPAAKNIDELAYVKLRYKKPDAEKSILIEQAITGKSQRPLTEASSEFRFAVAVAGFGQLLRGNTHIGNWRYEDARALAATAVGKDPYGYRAEFLKLVALAESLAQSK